MTDFAVRVKHLPPIENEKGLDELAAALTIHCERIVADEDEVFVGRTNSAIGPTEIVSVNFALRPFMRYESLLRIEKLV